MYSTHQESFIRGLEDLLKSYDRQKRVLAMLHSLSSCLSTFLFLFTHTQPSYK